jgi:hypothetical protein
VKRLALLLALAAVAVAASAAPASSATNECRGLMVCVSVVGPWVLVPTTGGAERQRTEYELKCPRRYIVGGLDAELSAREIELSFDGQLGSPVTPGVTTTRTALFRAAYVGARTPIASFRPRLGCVPTSGGGGRLPTAVRRVFPPGQPTIRHTADQVIRQGRTRIVRACGVGERLVRSWFARAFFTAAPPTPQVAAVFTVTPTAVRGERAAVTVAASPVAVTGGAVVQLGVVCAGGR